eukprot:scaffold3722_cov263-Pinguiococcus_pyrenoidosus.AAC.9
MAILDLAAVSKVRSVGACGPFLIECLCTASPRRPGAAGLSLCLQSASAVVPDECAAVLGAEDAEELAEAVTQVYPSEGMDIEEASLLQGKATEDPAAFQTPPRKRRAKSEDVESRKDDAGDGAARAVAYQGSTSRNTWQTGAITLERLLEMGFDFESAQAALKQEGGSALARHGARSGSHYCDLTAEKAINFLLKGEVPYASYDGMGGIARTPSPGPSCLLLSLGSRLLSLAQRSKAGLATHLILCLHSAEGVADIEERRSVGLDLEARAGVTELRSDAASTVEDDVSKALRPSGCHSAKCLLLPLLSLQAKTDELHAFGPINGVPNWDENLRKLLDMGFAREDCVVALQRFKNLDMAADALLNNGNVDQFRSYDASFQALD